MPILHFLSVTRKKTEAKRKTAKTLLRPFGSKRHPSGCRALSQRKKANGRSHTGL